MGDDTGFLGGESSCNGWDQWRHGGKVSDNIIVLVFPWWEEKNNIKYEEYVSYIYNI